MNTYSFARFFISFPLRFFVQLQLAVLTYFSPWLECEGTSFLCLCLLKLFVTMLVYYLDVGTFSPFSLLLCSFRLLCFAHTQRANKTVQQIQSFLYVNLVLCHRFTIDTQSADREKKKRKLTWVRRGRAPTVALTSGRSTAIRAPTRKSTATNTVRPSIPGTVSPPLQHDYLFYAMNKWKPWKGMEIRIRTHRVG